MANFKLEKAKQDTKAAVAGGKKVAKVLKATLKKKKVRETDAEGLAAAKAATTMTREQWQKHQVGMKAKWPQPAYMSESHPEGKGHTCYRDDTFELVTRWSAETKIAYRPHAKSPGSKSHVRYEHYGKAKTVGEALKLGSWPQDWCWDYERGYIKIIGPLRDEPIDISQVANDAELTAVDKAVYAWYRKELCRRLGLKLEDLLADKPSGESTIMRAHRLVSQREAKRVLAEADKAKRIISDADLTAVLNEWGFARNVTRLNVMQENIKWVWSDTLGLLRDRCGDIHLTKSTHQYPEVVQVMNRWLVDRLPADAKQFTYTSLNVNKDYNGRIHRDGNNFGPSMISAFGDFTGGGLNYWAEDPGKADLELLQKQSEPIKLDLKEGLALFNGNCAHCVDDFKGNRFSIVYFTLGCHAKMKPEDRAKYKALGVPAPSPTANPFMLLRPPNGYASKAAYASAVKKGMAATKASGSIQPSSRYWLKTALASSGKKRKA